MNNATNISEFLHEVKESELIGNTYKLALTSAIASGAYMVFGNNAVVSAGLTRTIGGFTIAGVTSNVTAGVSTVGSWIAKPALVLGKIGIYGLTVVVGAALGLGISKVTLDLIKPEEWEWLQTKLEETGWKDFDIALAENGLSYLPTAIVELYRDWFEYLGFFSATTGTIERQTSIPTATQLSNFNFLDVTAFSDLPVIEPIAGFNYRTNQYLAMQKVYKLFEDTYGYAVPANAYVFCQARRFEPRTDMMTVWIMENITSINFGTASGVDNAYERFSDGTLSINVGTNFNFANANGISTRFTVKGTSSSESGKVEIYSHQTNLTTATIPSAYRESTMTSAKLCQDNLGTTISSIPGLTVNGTIPMNGSTLAETYPAWYSDKLSVTTPDSTVDYVPVAVPRVDTNVSTDVITQADAQSGVIAGTYAESLVDSAVQAGVDSLTNVGVDVPANPPMLPIGATPINPTTPFDPIGMMAVYNPTINEVNQFSQFLWTTDFVDTVKKLFLDPFQGIIGFFQIYATPIVSEQKTEISIGWLGSNVMSKRVTDKFIEINCGTITPFQYYGNVLDFNPYTTVKIYLPFIGIVPLDANHVIAKSVNVRYKIDVTTATCIANIYCDDDLLYSFNGNCGVQIPLTGSNYSAVVTGLFSAGVGVASAVATGGLSGIPQIASGVLSSKTQLQQSGSLGSNAGVLAPRIPYLIIERPMAYDALGYPKFYGIPSNEYVKLSKLSGFTKIKDIHIENVPATDDEIDMIKTILTEGVII